MPSRIRIEKHHCLYLEPFAVFYNYFSSHDDVGMTCIKVYVDSFLRDYPAIMDKILDPCLNDDEQGTLYKWLTEVCILSTVPPFTDIY